MTDVRPSSFVDTLAGGDLSEEAKAFILNESADALASSPASMVAGAAFLRSIVVEGFRGIGSETKLALQPGPGLTVVVGSNGCGKSSFAEAVERLLTGPSDDRNGVRPMTASSTQSSDSASRPTCYE